MTSGEAAPELQVEFPPKPEYVGVARHTVAAMARMQGLPDDAVDNVRLAVSEACTNAVTANARLDPPAPVSLRAASAADTFQVEVMDRGPGIPQAAPNPDADPEFDSQDFSFEKNLSLPLIRGLVDDLTITERDGGGTVVRMRIPTAPIEAVEGQ